MASEVFQQVGSQLVSKVFSGLLWFGLGIIIVGVIGFLVWWFLVYRKKFSISVKVISQRAGDRDYIIYDTAAILTDRKTKTKYFRLWKTKIDLPAPNFNVLQTTSKGDALEIYRTSEDNFSFLTPAIIDKKQIVKADGKLYSIASQKQKMVEADIAFWMAKRMDQNKRLFDTESFFMKLLPYIPQILGGILIVFTLYILLNYLPQVLAELKELAATLNSYKASTTIEIVLGLLR